MTENKDSYISEKKRDFNIDLLKTVAIFFVIVIHVSARAFDSSIGGFSWTSAVLCNSLTRAAVPIFFMCSGALLLNPQKKLSVKKLFLHNILRVVVAMIFWSILYKFYHLIAEHNITFQGFKNIVVETLLFKQEFHLYYIHIILIVYIILPITKIITQNASKTQLEYLLCVWFVFAVIYPTVKMLYPFSALTGIPLQWLINMTYGSIGYTILGYYLKNYKLSLKYSLAFAIIGFVITFGGTYILSVKNNEFYSNLLEGMTIGVCFYAIGLFSLLASVKKHSDGIFSKTVTYISKASFTIYLCHVFFIYAMPHFKIDLYAIPVIISIPIVSVLIMILSTAVYFVFSKIPFLKFFS